MIAAMRRLAATALALLIFACDGETWLAMNDVPSFREVEAPEGRALAAQTGSHLLQVGRGAGAWTPLPGAQLLEPDEGWPSGLEAGGPVVIVAREPAAGFRLAARMARAGIQDVVVVSGGLEAWQAPEGRARRVADEGGPEAAAEEQDEIAATQRRTMRE
jgi:hypothetical protein